MYTCSKIIFISMLVTALLTISQARPHETENVPANIFTDGLHHIRSFFGAREPDENVEEEQDSPIGVIDLEGEGNVAVVIAEGDEEKVAGIVDNIAERVMGVGPQIPIDEENGQLGSGELELGEPDEKEEEHEEKAEYEEKAEHEENKHEHKLAIEKSEEEHDKKSSKEEHDKEEHKETEEKLEPAVKEVAENSNDEKAADEKNKPRPFAAPEVEDAPNAQQPKEAEAYE